MIGRVLNGNPMPFVNKVYKTIGYPSKFEAEFLYYVSGNNSGFLDGFLEDYVDSLNELSLSYDVLSDF